VAPHFPDDQAAPSALILIGNLTYPSCFLDSFPQCADLPLYDLRVHHILGPQIGYVMA
jgi:hypothetical protein